MKKIIRPIYNLFLRPKFRYYFLPFFRNVFLLSPRENILDNALSFVETNKIKGDYLEFGVWRGSNLISAYHLAKTKKHNLNMKFYAFDSFKGLPKLNKKEKSTRFFEGQYSYGLDDFKTNLLKNKVDLNEIKIVNGWFDKTLNNSTKKRLLIKKASIIWIDCDIYKSTVLVLDFITSYIQNGTVLFFGDWSNYKCDKDEGQQKAFYEWLKKNSQIEATQFLRFDCHSNSFILHIKEKCKTI